MKKATIVENSPNRRNQRQVTDFSAIEVHKMYTVDEVRKAKERDADFYEVDLSEEEDRKDKKAIMSLRKKNRRKTHNP